MLYFTDKLQGTLEWGGTPGYPVKLVINNTKTSSPQAIRFDACKVLSCGHLNDQRQLSGDNKYLCPEWTNVNGIKKTSGPEWSNVWWTTQSQGWMAPRAAGKPLKGTLHLAKGIPPDNCQDRQCNPLLLTIHNPQDLDSDPVIAPHVYRLGADVTGVDPVGRFGLNLTEDKTSPTVTTPILREIMSQSFPVMTLK